MEITMDLTKENVLDFLSSSAIYGNLGLFAGAGLSKAVLYDEFSSGALSWGELIENTCNALEIDYSNINKVGISYPEIATLVCEKYASENSISYEESKSKFKQIVCGLTNWYPNKEQRESFSNYLNVINPNWVITTNYDLVIESLLTGRCLSLDSQDYITSPKGVIPVYHLHGIRHNPDSIIITQEDYVQLFRPNEYRQIKLALTIKESTTLIVGYGLGDVNVLSAVDWSKNIYQGSGVYPHEIVQVVRSDEPMIKPYRDKSNIIIIETKEIKDFLDEFTENLTANIQKHSRQLEQIMTLNGQLLEANDDNVNKFISDQMLRLELLKVLSNFEVHMISPFIDFLSRCIDKTWENAIPRGAFGAYNQNLTILLDIVINIEFKKMPPALFEFVAYSLDRVLSFVGYEFGKGRAAAKTWDDRCSSIPKEMLIELFEYGKQRQFMRLKSSLESLVEV